MVQSWKFIDSRGTFELAAPHQTNHLYFPLVNEAGVMSAVTPLLHGDIKTGQHAFLTPPESVIDLHNSRASRNFWIFINGAGAWSAAGQSADQIANNFSETEEESTELQAGFLWHRVIRESKPMGIRTETTNFIPPSSDHIELMQVKIKNTSNQTIKFTPTAAIPIYGRSADNLRDHRHVTSLLHRISCSEYGVLVQPSLSFDERGHQPNQTVYTVLGTEADGAPPIGFFPVIEDFIGEGGSLDWPEAVVTDSGNHAHAGATFAGYEALGGLRFEDASLAPGQTHTYMLILGICPDENDANQLIQRYGSQEKFAKWFDKNQSYWQSKQENLVFQTGDTQFDLWLRWVGIQSTLRRLFGNSFIPYHDYGRGGRGWRDLWQDILALLIMETKQVDTMLFENFAGVRLDGSNATIIGSSPGEFKADRNNIPRVWMDHGAWPLLTTQLYINQTGDLAFLLRDQVYFKDQFIERAQEIDTQWDPVQGTQQLNHAGENYQGSILEHLLVQHLTAFFNVGEHNHIRLEGGDWNDGMDMAAQRGESVAFSAFYAHNLRQIKLLINELRNSGVEQVNLLAELQLLLDTLREKVDYDSPHAKQTRLQKYFSAVSHTVSGKKTQIQLSKLADDLSAKADWMTVHIREKEWISNRDGESWFNGYYDNNGRRLEGDHPKGVRMTLTGQVFTLMGDVATEEQAEKMIQSVERYLFDANVGGYRLNTDFKEVLMNMGRCFGFAYGHKENGAMFSHMAVMYAYALYERDYAHLAYKVLDQIYQQSVHFPVSRMYPGIPEYFDPRGRGVYPYLTGSASWYVMTMLTQSFGVRGQSGDLLISPKLIREQFDAEGKASVRAWFAGRRIEVEFRNPDRLDYGSYLLRQALLNNSKIRMSSSPVECRIPRQSIIDLAPGKTHSIVIYLTGK